MLGRAMASCFAESLQTLGQPQQSRRRSKLLLSWLLAYTQTKAPRIARWTVGES